MAAPWQVIFIAVTTLFNLVRFFAPILYFLTKKEIVKIPTFEAGNSTWNFPVFCDFTCGITCWLITWYILDMPSIHVWGVTIGWLFYSILDLVCAIQTSLVQEKDNTNPFPNSIMGWEVCGIPGLVFKIWCTFLIICQIVSVILLFLDETMDWFFSCVSV